MFLFGKSNKNEDSLRKGTIEKVKSRIMAVPHNVNDIEKPADVFARLQDNDEITIKHVDISQTPNICVEYKGIEYSMDVGAIEISISPEELAFYSLREEENEILLNATAALYIDMMFSDNNMESYHLQIKMLNMLVPNMAAIMDTDACKICSGRWAIMTAKSSVPPSPQHMFTIQAVSDKEKSNSVWLHTHGLKRCGMIELEILGTTVDNYSDFANVLNEIAYLLIGKNKFIDEKEPITIGVSSGNKDIVVTWQRSEWSFKDFPKGILGGVEDRDDEHSINMGVIYVYGSEKDAMNGKLTSILKCQKRLTDNPIYYKTTEETGRMRALAIERVEYLKKIYDSYDEKAALVKIGLTPDAKYDFDSKYHEYIWFEVNEMGEDTFKATLTQNAYYVEGMVEGVQAEYSYNDIVDWVVYTPDMRYTPDNVYQFD